MNPLSTQIEVAKAPIPHEVVWCVDKYQMIRFVHKLMYVQMECQT